MLRKFFTLLAGFVAAIAITSAQTPPDNEIWYTTHNGEAPVFFEYNNMSSLLSYKDDIGVIKFDDSVDIDYIISHAFRDWYSLTSITFGNGVTRIADDAFNGCFCLESVTIPNSVTEIGKRVFKGCNSLDSLTIPNSVTKIGEYAFEACGGLDSITIPDSVTEIGSFAFKGCSNLTSITVSNSVTEIGEGVFKDCYVLENIAIPNSVTKIGDYAFECCYDLKSVTIPDSVTEIGSFAFRKCATLTGITITIPNSVTKIGTSAFADCHGELIINCNIPDGKYTAGYSKVYWNYPLQDSKFSNVVIGDGVTKIGDYAFLCCSHLHSVTIPDSVTEIGNNAFGGCTWLQNITIPNGVTKIESEVFYNCGFLKSITIGSGVTEIDGSAFSRCSSLDSIIISNRYCYEYFKSKGKKVLLNSEYTSRDGRCLIVDGELTFCQLPGLLKYDIPEGVTKIGREPFKDCGSLSSLTIPDGVKEIGLEAFNGCSSLTNITIPESVTKIEESAFKDCSSLKNIKVANVLCYDILKQSGISVSAFTGSNASADGRYLINNGKLERFIATGLTSYDFPEHVTEIAAEALNECRKLQSATVTNGQCYDILKQSGISVSAFTGSNASADGRCLIINGELNVFIGEGATEYVIPQDVTKINDNVFNNCTGLTNITIPSCVTTIGDQQFSGCNTLASITFLATTPPAIRDLSIAETTKIYVPKDAVKEYKKDLSWEKYKKQIKPLN